MIGDTGQAEARAVRRIPGVQRAHPPRADKRYVMTHLPPAAVGMIVP
jgi:hypothetical protein